MNNKKTTIFAFLYLLFLHWILKNKQESANLYYYLLMVLKAWKNPTKNAEHGAIEVEFQETAKFCSGLYYYNARWYDPNIGRFTTEDSIRSGLNWYAYANNNPLKFVDPSGLTILDVKGDTRQEGAQEGVVLGKGKETIRESGCVLESAVRIAREISGDDSITIEAANEKAKAMTLFEGPNNDILTTESVAKLISGLTDKEIGYGTIEGADGIIKEGISSLDSDSQDYYVTGRIVDKHTVSINEGLTLKDYDMGIDQQPVVDTSVTDRTYIDDSVGGSEELTKADYFYVIED